MPPTVNAAPSFTAEPTVPPVTVKPPLKLLVPVVEVNVVPVPTVNRPVIVTVPEGFASAPVPLRVTVLLKLFVDPLVVNVPAEIATAPEKLSEVPPVAKVPPDIVKEV